MELIRRKNAIKQSLLSILDYMYDCSLISNANVLCAEILVSKIPDDINVEAITHKQLVKHYPELSRYAFDDLELINTEHICSTTERGMIKMTYMTVARNYYSYYEYDDYMRSDWC